MAQRKSKIIPSRGFNFYEIELNHFGQMEQIKSKIIPSRGFNFYEIESKHYG